MFASVAFQAGSVQAAGSGGVSRQAQVFSLDGADLSVQLLPGNRIRDWASATEEEILAEGSAAKARKMQRDDPEKSIPDGW